MTSVPLVSIITPSYNQARFLEQTIQSVLDQDYPAIEYLIVDGGSTDGSIEIIRRYSDRLTWWVSEPDSGQAEAVNKGFSRAKGDIVAWLNSDDMYIPGAVSQAADILTRETQLGMVYGDAISIDEKGRPLGKFSFHDWGLLDLASFRIICQPAVFMRRSVLELAGYLMPDLHFMLDHQLWLRIARLSPIRHIGTHLAGGDQPVAGLWAAARYHQQAKNVSQAASFGRETMQVLAWMEAQPDFRELISANRRRILAGAHRLNARYLLDDGMHKEALASYWRSLTCSPTYALKHAHRILYAVSALTKLDRIIRPIANQNTRQKRRQLTARLRRTAIARSPGSSPPHAFRLVDWPYLDLHDD